MISISLCMIVKNEQKNLGDCLMSLGEIADEVVIVDTGSSDDTRQIAREMGAQVYEFQWIDDFAAARNFAFSKASKDYILWLDADDRLDETAREAFMQLKQNLPESVDCVMMRYHTGFDADGNVTFSYYRERLLRRGAGFTWHEPVHEYIAVSGHVINSEIAVKHMKQEYESHSERNIRIYEGILAREGELGTRGQYYFARELMDHGRFAEAIQWFERFLNGGQGWMEDEINACLALGHCHMSLHQEKHALLALTRSFCYDTPRAEACCRLGYLYKGRGDHVRALFWFDLALHLKKPEQSWGFTRDDDWGYVPMIESAVCHYALGDLDRAEECNDKAAQMKPNAPEVKHNQAFFASVRQVHEQS